MDAVDVVIIGAGVAGLAAAETLRRQGRTCCVLEAAAWVGGRARTIQVAGAPFDLGATWLHDAARNPLVQLARAAGETLLDADSLRSSRLLIEGRLASAADQADYFAASARFESLATTRAERDDVALAEAVAPMQDDPWLATIETWEASQIAAADARDFSVRDWRDNSLEGANLWLPNGIGDFVSRALAPAAVDIRLNTPATRIAWDRDVQVETPAGTVVAQSCIVTVSTGVLAAGAIGFNPPLPPPTQAAIAGLPMGLLSKVALTGRWADRLGLPESCSIRMQVPMRFAPAMSFHCWPLGAPYIAGFVGGPTAWALSRAGKAASQDFVRERFIAMLGADAARGLEEIVLSQWGEDPLHRGSYAYARPGHAGARAVLGEPLAGGRLIFAGEATRTDGLAGTVGGAWLAGEAAAAVAA